MEVKILNEKESALLDRKEYAIELNYGKAATPSNDTVRKKISENLKVAEDLIKVNKVHQVYGEGRAVVYANVYKNVDSFKRFEEIKKKKKEAKKETGEAPKAEK